MIPLPETFDKDGFHFEQLLRNENFALYIKTKKGVTRLITSFEVIKITEKKAVWLKGIEYPAHEHYPNNCDWSKLGWTFSDHDKALDKMASLNAQIRGTVSKRRGASPSMKVKRAKAKQKP